MSATSCYQSCVLKNFGSKIYTFCRYPQVTLADGESMSSVMQIGQPAEESSAPVRTNNLKEIISTISRRQVPTFQHKFLWTKCKILVQAFVCLLRHVEDTFPKSRFQKEAFRRSSWKGISTSTPRNLSYHHNLKWYCC